MQIIRAVVNKIKYLLYNDIDNDNKNYKKIIDLAHYNGSVSRDD